mmetsp:Transcript_16984/g.50114  ORF Transcript_16984/g.50114 Transcript_16984/m.50114 type:complete len:197 (+) Transcript_16984:1038-1628(+)
MYNVSAHIHEALFATHYTAPEGDAAGAPAAAEPTPEAKIVELDDEAEEAEEAAAAAPAPPLTSNAADPPCAAAAVSADGAMTAELKNVKVTMLSEKFPTEMRTKAKYKGLFDVAYFGAGMVHHLKEDGAAGVLKPSAQIVLEGVQFYLGLTNEQKDEFATKVAEYATSHGAKPSAPNKGTTDAHYFFCMPNRTMSK